MDWEKLRAILWKIWDSSKVIAAREGPVLLIGSCVYTGVLAFLWILIQVGNIEIPNIGLVSIPLTLLQLPKTVSNIRRSKRTVLVKAAKAFGEGFLSVKSILPDILSVVWSYIRRLKPAK